MSDNTCSDLVNPQIISGLRLTIREKGGIMKHTVEEVRAHAAILRDWRNGFDPGVGNDDAAGMLDAHADLLERIKADEGAVPMAQPADSGRVTDGMVEDGCVAWNKSAGLGYAVADRDCMRAAIEAALAVQGRGEVYQCPECGTGMQVDPTAKPAPPASSAGVPDGFTDIVRDCVRDLRKHAKQIHDLPLLQQDLRRLANRIERKLAAAPSAPQGEPHE
jgi:hypothetical protein